MELVPLGPLGDFNDYLDKQLLFVTNASGFLSHDKTKYVFCLLLAYPLALLFRLLPNIPTLKHIVGIVLGVWFGFFTIGWQILHSFISSTVVYLMVKFLPNGVAHRVVFAFVILYIMVSHIYRMSVDYMGWSLDFTGPQMILTMKLSMYAFDVYDGTLKKEELVHPKLQVTRLTKQASLLEFYGYVYFFTTFLAGPTVWMRDYLDFIDMTLFGVPGKTPGPIPSGALFNGLLRLGYGFLTVGEVIAQGILPVSYMTTEEFAKRPYHYKLGYQWISAAICRGTYYFAWLISEGANIVIGLGYSGKKEVNGKTVYSWQRASNVEALGLELSQNFKELTSRWNKGTDKWLKYYIYFRVAATKYKKFDVIAVYTISAIWHGFYPGYYFSFGFAAVATLLARKMRRKFRPYFVDVDEKGVEHNKATKWIYDVLSVIVTTWSLSYIFSSFILLGFSEAIAMYSAMYFLPHIVMFVFFFLIDFFPTKRQKFAPNTKKDE
jgi:lysophospholipid acyltransferase